MAYPGLAVCRLGALQVWNMPHHIHYASSEVMFINGLHLKMFHPPRPVPGGGTLGVCCCGKLLSPRSPWWLLLLVELLRPGGWGGWSGVRPGELVSPPSGWRSEDKSERQV